MVILMEMILEGLLVVVDMEVGKVVDEVADMKVDKLTDMVMKMKTLLMVK